MKPEGLLSRIKKQYQIVYVVLLGIALLLVYLIMSSHYLMLSKSRIQVLRKLEAIATTSSMLVDGDAHERLSSKYQNKDDLMNSSDDSTYLLLHSTLKKVQETNSIESPIYTLVYDEIDDDYKFIVTSSDEPYYRHSYVNYPIQLTDDFDKGGVIDVYNSENGKWLSAFYPIKNSTGETVAILQVDEKFDSFISKANENLFSNVMLSLVLFIPLVIFLYRYISSSLNKQKKTQTALEESNEEVKVQNELIKESNIKLEKAKAIIERKNVNLGREVQQRTNDLVIVNQELETFLYRSSHDIQGPLATLRGLSQLATMNGGESGDDYFQMIEKSAVQLNSRIKSINSVFQVKRRSIEMERIYMLDFLKKTIQHQIRTSNVSGVNVKLNIDKDLCIDCDVELIKIIIEELVKNSIDYKEDSVDLEISVDVTFQDEEGTHIIFSDNGQGITDDVRGMVFEMFKRGNENSDGSGLGLYVAQLAVQKLNGSIELQPDNGIGASFKIVLPQHNSTVLEMTL